jgi:flagellar hook-associated protein 1
VQAIFNETSGSGLNQALSDFWNAWNTVSTNLTGAAERNGRVSKAAMLTQFIRDTDKQLNPLETDINDTMRRTVDQVNLLTHQIADLNAAITQAEAGGQQSDNDLRDQHQA